MTVSERFDQDIRNSLAAQYRRAPTLLRLGEPFKEGYWSWTAEPSSPASLDSPAALRLPHTFIAELNFSDREELQDRRHGVKIPLSQARELLNLAAGGINALAAITALGSAEDDFARRASIGTIARASLENSATALWVISGDDRDERLKRALLLEITGIEQLLKYIGTARATGEVSDLLRSRDAYVGLARDDLKLEVTLNGVPKIAGTQVPKKTELIEMAVQRNPYPELSSFAHPNSFHGATLATYSGGTDGQFFTVGSSSVHTEGRLAEPALHAFALALIRIAEYVGHRDPLPISEWITECVTLWNKWCTMNGC